jgi:hypothetical protein
MGSADLELILEEAWGPDPGSPPEGQRHVADVLTDVLAALSAARVEYVLGGTMAYGLYARARYTTEIEIIVPPGAVEIVEWVYAGLGLQLTRREDRRLSFMDLDARVELGVIVATALPEELALKDVAVHTIFGVVTLAAKPEYLVWLYACCSGDRAFADAATLAAEWPVDAVLLRGLLESAGDEEALVQVERILAAGERGRNSSYSKSVEARLKLRDGRVATPVWKLPR